MAMLGDAGREVVECWDRVVIPQRGHLYGLMLLENEDFSYGRHRLLQLAWETSSHILLCLHTYTFNF